MKLFKILLFIFAFTFCVNAQKTEELKTINKEIWQQFTKAFETLDYELFASIHDPNLIRISGNQKRIRFFKNYIDGYKNGWTANSTLKQTIAFRFIERIVDNGLASERGIYKLTINVGAESEKSYYGQFHVIHKKVNGVWKIIVDYDSNENNSINETSFSNATAIDVFDKF